ncbi:hypothetical protein [Neolewinella agarilytica]|uniref:Arrestin-like N-terminal domain-containing protein n=1 Tax=Neolewinella agarilytica TaxID=478744 RepID=A0A1H9LQA6_9BACT|nr:hypothetical protein [Neolewinella agarilytica]SER13570.1 hypothetical protein SAMN05444359_12523 [Neolewinella agarilytica]
MIKYPQTTIAVGKASLRIGCQLSQMSGQTDYHIGDRLTGELIVHPYMTIALLKIEARLEYILRGDQQSSRQYHDGLMVSRELRLDAGKQHRLPFSFAKPFHLVNYTDSKPKGFWRLEFTFYPQKARSGLMNSIRIPGGNPAVETTLQVPVVHGDGQFRALPKELDIQNFSFRESIAALIGFGFLFYLALATDLAETTNFLPAIFLWILLPVIAILLFRLYRFKDIPMELAETGDGKLKVRMLDRGDGHWKKMTLGYQVISSHVDKDGKKREINRRVLYKTDFPLEDIARPREHFIEATLPWPKWPHSKLPTSYRRDQQGYHWEIYLKTPGLLKEQVQTWPVAVSWEAFRLPGESVAESISEDVLELEPLKERVRLENDAAD